MQLSRHIAITLASLTGLLLVSCGVAPVESTADQQQAEQTAQMAAEANMQVGMPGITNFTEKRLARMLYELRDQENLSTFTYIVDRKGRMHFICDSIGYGLPYAVQFSNPERIAHQDRGYGGSFGTLPQPEPNGLFMPDSLSATWVMCSDPDGGEPKPMYVEPKIVVSPFRMVLSVQ